MKTRPGLAYLASLIFFLSGCSALIFETVWFVLTGLAVGNSVWGAAIVLSGFMGGLALGNGLIFLYGHKITRTVFMYFILELVIGITGYALVVVLPGLSEFLSPVFRPFLETLWVLNLLRFLSVFLLILVPATAMGMTLPLMVRALCQIDSNFGSVLGRLYGWNTFGAVCGTLFCEFYLLAWFGINNSGMIATLFNFAAAGLAYRLMNKQEIITTNTNNSSSPVSGYFSDYKVLRLLLAACLAGATLLAFEVIWFRFLLLKEHGTSEIFALMLAFVLIGISTGSLFAARLYRTGRNFLLDSRGLALTAGMVSVITYTFFDSIYKLIGTYISDLLISFQVYAFFLIAPVSFLSGMLFTTLGQVLNKLIKHETRSVGLLTLANTMGGMLGALVGALIFLPVAGMEISFFILVVSYAVIGLLIPPSAIYLPARYVKALFTALIILLVTFPFGTMRSVHIQQVIDRWYPSKVLAVKEGQVSTNIYIEYQLYGKPHSHRFITDRYSMSGTNWKSRRYMKLFVYLPVFLNSNMKDALLVSYGVGMTATALTSVPSLESIDIVDISKDALQMSRLLKSNDHPLDDPRVNVHIEDGRFYLQTTNKKYDLITGEPPPPGLNKVVSLYTQDYFRIIRDRLNKGGIVTYWLPVYQLPTRENLSIIKAFCNVFSDCTLWTGAGLEWILMGSNGGIENADINTFTEPWRNSEIKKALENIVLEKPEQIGPLFLADADFLSQVTHNIPPLTDNYPKRIGDLSAKKYGKAVFYEMFMNEVNSEERFRHSSFIQNTWPDQLRQESLEYFDFQRMLTGALLPKYRKDKYYYLDDLHRVLTSTDLEILALVLLGSDVDEQNIVRQLIEEGNQQPEVWLAYARGLLAKRNIPAAISIMEEYPGSGFPSDQILEIYLYALYLGGETEKARDVILDYKSKHPQDDKFTQLSGWLDARFKGDIIED